MFTPRIGRTVLALVVAGVLPFRAAVANGRMDAQNVPGPVAAAAGHGTVEQLAEVLAAAQIPAGFVVLEEDTRRSPLPLGDTAALGTEDTPVSEAVRLFESRHPKYTLVERDRVWEVRPRVGNVCTAVTQKRIESVQMAGRVYEVFDALQKAVNPRIPHIPPSVVCGGGDCGADPSSNLFDVPLTFSAVTVSFEEALSQIARQVPGIVWALREQRDGRTGKLGCVLTYYYPGGKVTQGWDLR